MKPVLRYTAIATLVGVTTLLSSQERIPLAVTETYEASELVDTAVLPAKCGPDGAAYARFFNGYVMAPSKLSADAKKIVTFGLDGTRYFGHAHIWDFSPTEDGGIYEVIFYRLKDEQESGYRLLTFDKDGKLTRDVRLDIPFEASHIASLGNRSIVVEGRKTTPELGGHTGESAMVIVNESGQLVSKLRLEGDLKRPIPTGGTKGEDKSAEAKSRAEEEFNSSINLSSAISADDGNVYVLRQSPTGPLFAISTSGVVRTINLPKYDDALINAALVARGQVLIHYVRSEIAGEGVRKKTDLGFYAVYELATMRKIVEYGLDPASPIRNSMPVCYDLNQVSFLRVNAKHHPVLLIAKPQ